LTRGVFLARKTRRASAAAKQEARAREPEHAMLSPDEHELLVQARRRTLALLETLEQSRAQLSDPMWSIDAATAAEGHASYTAVIDAARGTLDNLDRALNGNDDDAPATVASET
jgi:hypothetical protein